MPIQCNPATALYALVFVGSIISLILGALSWSRTTGSFLPLPGWVPAIATLLSPVTAVALVGIRTYLQRESSGRNTTRNGRFGDAFGIFDQLHTIISTAIATVALAYLFPDTILSCHLDRQWQSYFQAKNSHAIRTIQDQFQCCGLRSTHDRAWPFKDADHDDRTCERQLGYQQSCFGPWRRQQKNVSWMIFMAALLIWAVKIWFGQVPHRRTSWMNSQAAREIPEHQRIADSEAQDEGEDEERVNGEPRRTLLPQASASYDNQWGS